MDTSGGNPWAWFMSLESPEKLFAGLILAICAMAAGVTAIMFIEDGHPGPVRRFLTGLILTLALIIYFWPTIHHFFFWWLPLHSLPMQAGALCLVSFCLIIFGHNIECGLLGAGTPYHDKGNPREFGCSAALAMMVLVPTIAYSIIATSCWALGSLWEWIVLTANH